MAAEPDGKTDPLKGSVECPFGDSFLCQGFKDCIAAGKVIDGSGDISLTAEEHEVLTEYFRLRFRLDDMERQRLYFRGHTDCISYLKKVGVLN